MKPASYHAAVAHITRMCATVTRLADAQTPRDKAHRTRAVNALCAAARRLQRRNAAV